MRDLFPVSTNDFLYPDNVFDNFFGNIFQPTATSQLTMPKVDIQDTDKSYIVTADLPGVTKEDVSVTYDNDILTIAAQHHEEKEDKDEDKHFIRKERTSSSFKRQFVVRNIAKDSIDAAFENGVLKITLPKVDPKQVESENRIAIR